jgi:tetratricopeptide (TPR) repeat protein
MTALAQDPERLATAMKERALLDNIMRLKTDDRIKVYSTLTGAKPENLHYQNLLAATYVQKMRETTDPSYLARASKVLDGVLAVEGSNYEALRLRNEVELENHNFRKVVEGSKKLVKIAPDDPWNWGTLGDALMELGEYNEAAEAYQKMVTLRPDLSSYNRAAWYRYVAGDRKGAIELMKMAISAGSRSGEHMAWCWVELGNLYLRGNETEEAAKAFAAAAKYQPNYHSAYGGIGKALAASGDTKGAIEAYKKAQSIVPMPDYAGALHDLYLREDNQAEAAKQLATLDVLDKMGQAAKESCNRTIALIYADKNHRVDRALELAKAEIALRQDIFTWDALAWALYKNRQYDEAQKAIEKALSMGTPEAQFHYHAGMIAAARGDKANAAKHLEKALELNPAFDAKQAAVAREKLAEVRG